MVVIGASHGGYDALKTILAPLPSDFPVPILIVQHLLANSTSCLAELLNNETGLTVQFASDGERPKPGHVYLAPPNYHLLVDEKLRLKLTQSALVHHSRPAIDLLFTSAATVVGKKLLAVVLTGANSDGAAGLKDVDTHGGFGIVQDPDSAMDSTMPLAALLAVPKACRVSLNQLGPLLWTLVREGEFHNMPLWITKMMNSE